MIISRTPLRISFVGGGTDYEAWFRNHPGAVLGVSINHYCYVVLHDGRSNHFFDLPTKSGLGSSSAYTVGLLRACTDLNKPTIAKLATTWEVDKTGGNVGFQDQHLCAMGGFRHLRFSEHGVRDTLLDESLVSPLQDYLMLFDTHQYRRGSEIIAHQLAEMEKHETLLTKMAEMATDGLTALRNKDYLSFGQLLEDSWFMKRELSPYVSTPEIDSIYQTAKASGARGGKLLGAGGGGFIIFFVEPSRQIEVKRALEELTYVPFKFEWEGTKILYHD